MPPPPPPPPKKGSGTRRPPPSLSWLLSTKPKAKRKKPKGKTKKKVFRRRIIFSPRKASITLLVFLALWQGYEIYQQRVEINKENKNKNIENLKSTINSDGHEIQSFPKNNGLIELLLHDNVTTFSNKSNSAVIFVFIVGLEGTGHHFMHSFLRHSPSTQTLNNMQLLTPEYLPQLVTSLFRYNDSTPSNSLFTSFCTNTIDRHNTNSTEIYFQRVVHTMETIQKKFQAVNIQSKIQLPLVIPVNTLIIGTAGMMSYPNFYGPCRSLYYPNLQLFYRACSQVQGISCNHLYMYRSPTQVLSSTVVKRPINLSMLQAIHQYISQLYVIHAQLSKYANATSLCYGLYDNPTFDSVWNPLGKIFGFHNNMTQLQQYVQSKYKAPQTSGQKQQQKQQQQQQQTTKYTTLINALTNIHNLVIETCQQNEDRVLPKKQTFSISDLWKYIRNKKESPKFVFVIGLEGAGHDLVSQALQQTTTYIDNILLNNTTIYNRKRLSQALYSKSNPGSAIWSAHCSNVEANMTKKEESIVRILKRIHEHITISASSLSSSESNKNVLIPINFIQDDFDNVAHFTYPIHNDDDCRYSLNYPNLDLLHHACDEAKVQCEHLYIYRDPYYMIPKAVTPKYYSSIAKEFHLYSTLLNIIYGQLTMHADRTIGCIDMMQTESINIIQDLFFHHSNSTNVSMPELPKLQVPSQYRLYFQNVLDSHKQVLKACNNNKF